MGSYRIVLTRSAEEELRASPFPFRRQIVQALHKLKEDSRPPTCSPTPSGDLVLPVHGWSVVYEADDAAKIVTVYRIRR